MIAEMCLTTMSVALRVAVRESLGLDLVNGVRVRAGHTGMVM